MKKMGSEMANAQRSTFNAQRSSWQATRLPRWAVNVLFPLHRSPFTVHRSLTSRAGLTLIEVLLALAILAATAGVLMTAVGRCLGVVRQSKNYYAARRVLDMGELEHPLMVTKDPIDKKDKVINLNVGPIDYENGYTFTRSGDRSATMKDLVVVKTRVAWSARGRETCEEVMSYLYYTNDLEAP